MAARHSSQPQRWPTPHNPHNPHRPHNPLVLLALVLCALAAAASAASCDPDPCPPFHVCSEGPGGEQCDPVDLCGTSPCPGGYSCAPDTTAAEGYRCDWNDLCPAYNCPEGLPCQSDPVVIVTCLCPPGATYDEGARICKFGNPCDGDPCPGSECIDFGNGNYQCSPPGGNPCDQTPCGNTGEYTCVPDYSTSQGYRCDWNGYCSSAVCPDGATCVTDPAVLVTCLCPGGATYDSNTNTCSSPDPCQGNPCPPYNDCVDHYDGTYHCVPLFGDPCNPNPCGYSGDYVCVPDSSNSQGYYCDFISLCPGFTCPDGATCQSDPTVILTCLCPGDATYNMEDNTCASSDPCAQNPCAHGSCVPADSQATCDCTGTGFKGPTCSEQIQCEAKSEANAAWPSVNAGSTTTGSCAPGFQGVISRDCQLDGTFGPIKGSCLPLCPAERYNNATWPATVAGQVATGTCDDGFSGTPKRRCQPNGTWKTNLDALCTRTRCGSTTEGNAVWSSTISFQAVTGQCLPGFQGRAWRSCQGNGEFGPINGGCTAIPSCPAISFLHVAWPETQPGQTATGTCDPGYDGTPLRTCSDKGYWQAVSVPCQRQKCLAVNEANASWNESVFGDLVIGACQAPYAGRVHRKCLEGGVYGPITGTCFGPCPAMIDGPAAFGQTSPSQTATGVCQQGYTGTPTKYCTKEGIWQAGGRACQVIMCNSMTDAVATFLRTAAGTTSTGRCRKGTGVITRFCNLDGTFAPAQGACI